MHRHSTSWFTTLFTAACFSIATGGCSAKDQSVTPELQSAVAQKQSMIVQHNMWWGPGRWPGMRVVYATNYKMGPMIPVNAEITFEEVNDNQLSFHYDGQLIILCNTQQTMLGMSDVIEQNFAPQKVDLSRFSQAEQDHILLGEIATGMSKESVLISRGYPPKEMTPSLKADTWKYWDYDNGRESDTLAVHFKDGKVSGFTE